MISVSTFAFAHALVVVAFGAAAWIIWSRLTLELESQRSTTTRTLAQHAASIAALQRIASELKRAAPTTLAAEVADLAAAVSKLRQTHQRFAGRFDQYVGQEVPNRELPAGTSFPHDRSYAGVNQLDPELAAELALQLAPPADPGARANGKG